MRRFFYGEIEMLKDIVKKEILDHLLSSKFLLMFIICSALILLSVFMGISGYLLDKKEHEASVAALREDFQALETADENFTPGTMRIYRPPRTLKTLVNGVSDAAGRMSRPSNMQESYLEESKYGNNPDLTVFGALDLEFIVRVVLSLFALLFTFDAISGERERGTLKMALANNVSRARLLIGKAVGGYVSMMLPLLVPFLLGLVILSLYPGVVLTGGDWQRIGLIFTLFLLYLSVFFALGLLVSSLTARSATSFFALLALWAALVMVVPDLSAIAAAHIRPVPDASEISLQKGLSTRQIGDERDKTWNARSSEQMQALRQSKPSGSAALEQYRENQKTLEQIHAEFTLKINEANARIDRDYQLRKEAQAGLAKNLSRISPAAGLTLGAAALAGTGVDEYGRFTESARNYGVVLRDWYTKTNEQKRRDTTILRNPNPDGSPVFSVPMGDLLTVQEALSSMPGHKFAPESLELSLRRALPDFALMAAMTILFFAGACVAFMRYDVR
jgi:ABC-type transport system involved in multi-copper enzyme maturation permease subunit